MELRTATAEDLPIIVDTAARSLHDEAMLRWSFGEERFEAGAVLAVSGVLLPYGIVTISSFRRL